MLRLFTRGFLWIVLAAAWLPIADSDAQTTAGLAENTTLEREAFGLINQYRKENNLPALVWNSAVADLAREHSKDMATGEVDFGHEGFSDRMSRLKKTLEGMAGGGENVFMTDNSDDAAQSAVDVWLKSPPHLHNIRGDYNNSGMGIWVSNDGTIYFTQIFVKLRPLPEEANAVPAAESAAGAPGIFFAVPMPTKQ